MNIDEAKALAEKGYKITHRFFHPDEYIGINKSGEVYTENPNEAPVPWEWFMESRRRLAWMTDWEIWIPCK